MNAALKSSPSGLEIPVVTEEQTNSLKKFFSNGTAETNGAGSKKKAPSRVRYHYAHDFVLFGRHYFLMFHSLQKIAKKGKSGTTNGGMMSLTKYFNGGNSGKRKSSQDDTDTNEKKKKKKQKRTEPKSTLQDYFGKTEGSGSAVGKSAASSEPSKNKSRSNMSSGDR